eukprot:TRINITY_DN2353_c0_g1_i2.p1 TRINITY_DN2353_c0_g1~~TRINITY_DN2353_c0_g1_i2.p1  ORF type:complete len:518 (+),score=134.11 TRINITY_DN2353_c0_g1_i2:200-1753(+)
MKLFLSTKSLLTVCVVALLLFVSLVNAKKEHHEDHHDDHHEEEGVHLRNETNPVNEVMETYDEDDSNSLDEHEFEAFFHKVFLGEEHEHGEEEEEHDGHEHEEHKEDHKKKTKRDTLHKHRRFKRSAIGRKLLELEADDHDHDGHDHEDHEGVDCPDAEHLFEQFDANHNGELNKRELKNAMLAMTSMIVDGCEFHEETEDECQPPSTAERWGYAILSSIIITLIAVVGIVLIPLNNKKIREYIIDTLIAFAVGALLGDAILHLLPEAFGVHDHGGEEDSHAHGGGEGEEEDDHSTVLYRGMLVLATMLGCYYFERFLNWLLPGGHSHAGHAHGTQGHHAHESNSDVEGQDKSPKKKRSKFSNIASFGWLNLISDCIHNFVDGLVMGFSWSVDLDTGFKTTLAIAFHELPQEFGDFGLLVKAGFTKWQALGLNLMTAAAAIIGTLIGVGVGTSVEDATAWIQCVTAGFFIYIALADMIPELMSKRKGIFGFLHFIGISVGIVVMFILGKYGELDTSC